MELSPPTKRVKREQFDFSGWKRPQLVLSPSTDHLDVYVVSIEVAYNSSCIEVYAINDDQNTVCIRVTDFKAYMYIKRPSYGDYRSDRDLKDDFVDILKEKKSIFLAKDAKYQDSKLNLNAKLYDTFLEEPITLVEDVSKIPFEGVHDAQPMWRICFKHPALLKVFLRASQEKWFKGPPFVHFEGDVLLRDRFIVDTGVSTYNWATIPLNADILKTDKPSYSKMQLNIQVPWQDMVSHTNPFDKDSRWTNIPPIRFIVTDIECAGRPAIFPTPSEDSVIMQSIVMGTVGGKQGVLKKAIVSWGKVDFESDKGIPDDSPDKRHAYCVQYEHQLFTTVTDLINAADPDLIFTYNGTGFDFPYICNRLKHLIENKLPQNLEELMSIEPIQHNPEQEKERLLNIKRLQYEIPKLAEAYCMGRKYDSKVSLKSWKPQQRAKMGRNSEELLGLTGRVHLDVLTAIVRAEKLRSYTLNAVAMKFLGKSKYDVHHSQITKLWRSGVKGRTRVAEYCIQDSILPFELVISNKLQLLFRNAMIAKITQLPFYDILYKGQTAKVLMMIRRWLIKFNMVNQTRFKDPNKTTEPQGYEGAIVIPPKPAFFGTKKIKLPDGTIKEEKNPVITNDFNSLYPTIVIDFNLCYSTHLSDAQAKQAKWVNKFHSTYEGAHFLDTEVRKGLLPDLLEYLLDARLQLKSMMKAEPNPDKKSVLDGIQLGAKLVANSLYGFTGFEGLNMPDLGIASGVTSYGRANIELTTDFVENYVNNLLAKEGELNPNDPDDRVIVRYGDTDSFMATIPKKYRESIKLAMEFGRRSAKMCTDFLRNIDKYAQYVSPQYQDKLANLITVRRTKVNLEFEKVFCPWIVWKKKRYAGAKYMSNPDTPDDIHVSGAENKRRDWCALTTKLLDKLMKLILKKSDIDKAIKKVKEVTVKLLKSEVPISDLIIIKEYTKPISEFKNAKSLPIQIMVVKDLMKRDPNNAPKVGQRIPFVVIDRGTADKHSAGSCGLDPMVAMNENVDIDYMYYIEKQIKKPVVRFFVPIYGSEAKAEKYLFSWLKGITVNPDLEFKRKINPSLKAVCKICARSSDNKYGICTRCLKSSSDPIMVKLGEQFNTYLIMKEEVDKTWDICRKCQRDDDMAMLESCKASDCGNWYDRRTTKNKLEMKVQTIEDIKTKVKPDFFNKVCLLGGAPEFTHDNKGPKIKLEMETA